ncbi:MULTISPECIES: DUF3500 domain-containing protein [Parafrankia]|uniref:DUF3500 domain-containing protein n=1 Tax=Parafrankia TaxID=2994362 RepID=UPI0013F4C167|nr:MULTISPECIES: DUF3500 domain-containing protein [Parafrankia]MBE3202520.1 DUF3500 domain-containing protein [Parafrankia sp. CH37]
MGAVAALLIPSACSSSDGSADPSATTAATAPAGESVTPEVTAAAKEFLATLDDSKKDTVSFEWSDDEQKKKWSNFPAALYSRSGLRWGDMSETQQNAWLKIMKVSLSTEGYNRVLSEWDADEALAKQTGQTDQYGKQYYYLAVIGTPSDSSPWMWQWGGHHVTVNATIASGVVSVTPSFIGDQPASYTDADGKTVRPLGDIEDEAFALVDSLDDDQKKAAVLGETPIDLVLGPGEDGRTIAAEGLALSELNSDQQAAALKVIGHYTGLVDDTDAATRMNEVQSVLDQTYLAWYGPTTKGSAAYFRFSGPNLVIEYSPQGGMAGVPGAGGGLPGGGTPPSGAPQNGGTPPSGAPQNGTGLPNGGTPPSGATQNGGAAGQSGGQTSGASTNHIHGVYRDPSNEYGAKYTS